jgi:hypothetical protein
MVDLRDVVHRGDAGVELAQRAEELVDVDVLRPVDRGEPAEDVLEIVDRPVRLAVVEQQPVGEEAAQRRLELVVVRVDEPGHHDASARVDDLRAGSAQVAAHRRDPLALDEHVGFGEVPDLRVHRHDVAAANQVAPARPAAIARRVVVALRLRCRRGEQAQAGSGRAGRGAGLQEFTA